mmetsp:Transcript_51686/g.144429  ORF Transcript_51686/g.144429 Transcript_51686/m.144429 type:complete len:335 (+) Transcript_51686:414-1418(+)
MSIRKLLACVWAFLNAAAASFCCTLAASSSSAATAFIPAPLLTAVRAASTASARAPFAASSPAASATSARDLAKISSSWPMASASKVARSDGDFLSTPGNAAKRPASTSIFFSLAKKVLESSMEAAASLNFASSDSAAPKASRFANAAACAASPVFCAVSACLQASFATSRATDAALRASAFSLTASVLPDSSLSASATSASRETLSPSNPSTFALAAATDASSDSVNEIITSPIILTIDAWCGCRMSVYTWSTRGATFDNIVFTSTGKSASRTVAATSSHSFSVRSTAGFFGGRPTGFAAGRFASLGAIVGGQGRSGGWCDAIARRKAAAAQP